jgi:hypothetical protein
LNGISSTLVADAPPDLGECVTICLRLGPVVESTRGGGP